jgi:creatinine amidohydrolase/Fe(II)-dependent formamide hydrolase-like protein
VHAIPGFDPRRYLPFLSTVEVSERAPESLAVLPVGSIEQHGPHLPVGTDLLIGQIFLWGAISRLPADRPVLALAPIAYGRSNEHDDFAGTISLHSIHLYDTLIDIGDSLARSGFRRLALWNSHGGNRPVVEMAGRDIRARTGLKVFVINAGLAFGSYPLSPEEQEYGLHAGDVETSILLATFPDLVHLDRLTAEMPAFRLPEPGQIGFQLEASRGPAVMSWITTDLSRSGVLGDPRTASAENGRKAIERGSDVLATLFAQALDMP